MLGKNNQKEYQRRNGQKNYRYAIKKIGVGVFSVAVGFALFGQVSTVAASESEGSPTALVQPSPNERESNGEDVVSQPEVENLTPVVSKPVEVSDKSSNDNSDEESNKELARVSDLGTSERTEKLTMRSSAPSNRLTDSSDNREENHPADQPHEELAEPRVARVLEKETAGDAVAPEKLEEAKRVASEAVDKASGEAIAKISLDNNLSEKEREYYRGSIEHLRDAVKEDIEKASEINRVMQLKEEALKQLAPSKYFSRGNASRLVRETYEKELAAITKNMKLSSEERERLKAELTKTTEEAIDNIRSAESEEEVNKVQIEAEKAIRKINPENLMVGESRARSGELASYLKELDEQEKQEKAIINAQNSTAEEREKFLQQLVKIKEEGIAELQKMAGQGDDALRKKVEEIKDKMADHKPEEKNKVIGELDNKARELKEVIQKNTTLSTQERNNIAAQIDELLKKAIQDIDVADKTEMVEKVKAEALVEIQKIAKDNQKPKGKKATEEEKILVKEEIAKAIGDKIAKVIGNKDLTEDEVEAAKDQLQNLQKNYDEKVSTITHTESLNSFKEETLKFIDQLRFVGKKRAKETIQQVLKEKLDEINKNDNLLKKEREEAKGILTEKVNKTVKLIDSANKPEEINRLSTELESEIRKFPLVGKAKLIDRIDYEGRQKIAAINALKISQTEKDSAIKKIKEQAIKAKGKIEQAISQREVDQFHQTVVEEIGQIESHAKQLATGKVTPSDKDEKDLLAMKEAASSEIDRVATEKAREIEQNNNLTRKEKDIEKAWIAYSAKTGKEEIRKASRADLEEKKNKAIQFIQSITPVTRDLAISEVNKVAKAKMDAIEGNKKLSAEEKKRAKEEVKNTQAKADYTIKTAQRQEVVDKAKDEALAKFKSLQPVGKMLAESSIKEALKAKQDEIVKNAKLSEKEKTLAQKKISQLQKTAEDVIARASQQADVDKAKDEALTAIQGVKLLGKELTYKALEAIREKQMKAIEANNKLSVGEKEAARNSVANVAAAASEDLEDAETQEDVDKAGEKAKQAFEGLKFIGKDLVTRRLQQAAKEKTEEIQQNAKASDEAKKVAVWKVETTLKAVVLKLEKLTSQTAVDQLEVEELQALKAISVETSIKAEKLVPAQTQAPKKDQAQPAPSAPKAPEKNQAKPAPSAPKAPEKNQAKPAPSAPKAPEKDQAQPAPSAPKAPEKNQAKPAPSAPKTPEKNEAKPAPTAPKVPEKNQAKPAPSAPKAPEKDQAQPAPSAPKAPEKNQAKPAPSAPKTPEKNEAKPAPSAPKVPEKNQAKPAPSAPKAAEKGVAKPAPSAPKAPEKNQAQPAPSAPKAAEKGVAKPAPSAPKAAGKKVTTKATGTVKKADKKVAKASRKESKDEKKEVAGKLPAKEDKKEVTGKLPAKEGKKEVTGKLSAKDKKSVKDDKPIKDEKSAKDDKSVKETKAKETSKTDPKENNQLTDEQMNGEQASKKTSNSSSKTIAVAMATAAVGGLVVTRFKKM